MKVSRRGLGGLLAGAAAAFHGGKAPTPLPGGGHIYDTVKANAPDIITPVPPEERIAWLLEQRKQDYLAHYRKRDRYSESMDPDVAALRSCSPSGRDIILRTRQARQQAFEYNNWAQAEIDAILKQYPLLKAFT